MSYILDALKKSERERQRGEVPDVMTVQNSPAVQQKRRRMWPYVIATVLLLSSGVFVWQLPLWRSEKPVTAPQSAAAPDPPVRTAIIPDIHDTGKEAAVLPAQRIETPDRPVQDVTSEGNQAAAHQLQDKKAVTVKSRGKSAPADFHQPAAGHPKPLSPNQETGMPAPDNRIKAQKDLPQPVLQGLPPITMSVHYYDTNPELRMVRINGQTVREGGEVVPGLTLEEINPGGAVLSFQGHRFRTGLPK